MTIIAFVGIYRLYKYFGYSGLVAIVPIVNTYFWLSIAFDKESNGKFCLLVLLGFLPITSIFIGAYANYRIACRLGCSDFIKILSALTAGLPLIVIGFGLKGKSVYDEHID